MLRQAVDGAGMSMFGRTPTKGRWLTVGAGLFILLTGIAGGFAAATMFIPSPRSESRPTTEMVRVSSGLEQARLVMSAMAEDVVELQPPSRYAMHGDYAEIVFRPISTRYPGICEATVLFAAGSSSSDEPLRFSEVRPLSFYKVVGSLEEADELYKVPSETPCDGERNILKTFFRADNSTAAYEGALLVAAVRAAAKSARPPFQIECAESADCSDIPARLAGFTFQGMSSSNRVNCDRGRNCYLIAFSNLKSRCGDTIHGWATPRRFDEEGPTIVHVEKVVLRPRSSCPSIS